MTVAATINSSKKRQVGSSINVLINNKLQLYKAYLVSPLGMQHFIRVQHGCFTIISISQHLLDKMQKTFGSKARSHSIR